MSKKSLRQNAKVANFQQAYYGVSPLLAEASNLFAGIAKSFALPQEYLFGFSKPDYGTPDQFYESIKQTTDKLAKKHNESMSKLHKLVEAKAKKVELVQYGQPGENAFIGVRTPYNAGFVASLKMEIPQKDRKWDGSNKEWVVAGKHLGSLMIMVKDHYGIEPVVSTVGAKDSPLSAKPDNDEVILHVSLQWIEIQTPYDVNFLADLKEFFDSKKWQASVKRWKVPYSKENLNMAAYLIKRHYDKVPEIKKLD